MNIDFIQGIVTYPATDSDQLFLEKINNYVNLTIDTDQLIVSIAHGASNYMVTEATSVPKAWDSLIAGDEYWLYIDIHKITGIRTFGSTQLSPITSKISPSNPAQDQHWFNTSINKMCVFNLTGWTELIRVFVASVIDSTFNPLGSGFIRAPYAGSQVGLSAIPDIDTYPILVDDTNRPLAHADGRLFTVNDPFFTPNAPYNAMRMDSNIVSAVAGVRLTKFQIVQYTKFDTVVVASYNDTNTHVIAIALQDAEVGDNLTICIQGHVTNPQWLFSEVNQLLWIGNDGQITDVDLSTLDSNTYPNPQSHIARVITPTSISFNHGMIYDGSSKNILIDPVSRSFTKLTDGLGSNYLINDGQNIWNWRTDSLVDKNESGLIVKTLDTVVLDDTTRTPGLLDIFGLNNVTYPVDTFRINKYTIGNASSSVFGINHSGTTSLNADGININSAKIVQFRSPVSFNNIGLLTPSASPSTIKIIMSARGSYPFEVDGSLRDQAQIDGSSFPEQPINSIWSIRGRIVSGVNSDVYCEEFNLVCVRTPTQTTIIQSKTNVTTQTIAYTNSIVSHVVLTSSNRLRISIDYAPAEAVSALSLYITQVGANALSVTLPTPTLTSISGASYVALPNEFITSAIYGNLIQDTLQLTSSILINSSLISVPSDTMTLGSSVIDSGTLLETVVYLSTNINEPSLLDLGPTTLDIGTLQQTISYTSVNVSDSSILLLNSSSIETASLTEVVSYIQYSITDPSKLILNSSTIISGTLL